MRYITSGMWESQSGYEIAFNEKTHVKEKTKLSLYFQA